MENKHRTNLNTKKINRPTDRPMTTALFMLRCLQVGLSLDDLDKLEIGLVNDMFIEMANDHEQWNTLATQEDMNKF